MGKELNVGAPGPVGATDPLGTGELRRRVLDAWTASAARFREDANAEEDLVLGGYRDRVVVELAQNAADAAARRHPGAMDGRLRLTLRDGCLAAANTGSALDAAGVESLSTLRASAKRPGSAPAPAGPGPFDDQQPAGRFGVGFAAVLAVSDEPAVLSRTGGVRWSRAEATGLAEAAAEANPDLADEIRRRDGAVPVLRLPLPAEGMPPSGYDTVVVLPLRDGAAEDLVRRLLAEIDDALLLALPQLAEIVVEVDGDSRVLRRTGWTTGRPAVLGADGEAEAPALHTVTIEDTAREPAPGRDAGATTTAGGGVEQRWQILRASGDIPAELAAHLPVEDRLRRRWSLTWAVPVDADGAPLPPRTARVVHAPTPSDEPLDVPALLVADFPLDPTRRHIAPGPLTDLMVERAAAAYADLIRARGPRADSLALVPTPFGRGELEMRLRGAVLRLLPAVPFLPPARPTEHPEPVDHPERARYDAGGDGATATDAADPVEGFDRPAGGADVPDALRPAEAVVLEGADARLVGVLAGVLPGLLPAGLTHAEALRTLGVRRTGPAEVVDGLAGLRRPPAWWHRLYSALTGVDPEALGALPVPLADGRTAFGPRRVLLPVGPADPFATGGDAADAAAEAAALARLGLRVAHPAAAHPLLEKLGAVPATPRAVLQGPELRAAVARSVDDYDDQWDYPDADGEGGEAGAAPAAVSLADLVLRLVRDADLQPGDLPHLAALALPDEEGEPTPAGELLLPGSELADLVRPGSIGLLDEEYARRWPAEVLAATGVVDRFRLLRASEVLLDPDDPDAFSPAVLDPAAPDIDGVVPDGIEEWSEDVLRLLPDGDGIPPVAAELTAVRDLDLIDDDAWPRALRLLSRPPLRAAVVDPVRVRLPDGGSATVPSYTAWWLREHPVLDGRRPGRVRSADGDPLLRGLYPEVRTDLDDAFLRALGVRTTVAALLAEPDGVAELLDRMGDPALRLTRDQLRDLYTALGRHAATADPEDLPADPPERLWAVVGDRLELVDPLDAVVVDAPDLLPFFPGVPLLPVRPAQAEPFAHRLLEVDLASEIVPGRVVSEGVPHEVPEAVRRLLPGAPDSYEEHDELWVVGPAEGATSGRPGGTGSDAASGAGDAEEREVEVDWRWDGERLHAATLDGVAAGLAWAAGEWPRRFEVAILLAEPDRAEQLAGDRDFD
ncbi:sacsin N-terminal ATP-binding-like domain-containing protein [Allostreptomyces psammosilenae]|uniref:Molecular chaperone Hsp90 n=1 Tax=Allostreptomyces psammosilenae TaxID=1892865 RepID=A0A853A0N6_9ACTN|nr:molecular chaperone Hsp90 [Allostreptomyces psammosilenae]NYI07697.1 hypothetical protein [Allostreptomyces psammosilenae]